MADPSKASKFRPSRLPGVRNLTRGLSLRVAHHGGKRLFDQDFYLDQLQGDEVPPGGAFQHFLRAGAWLGRDPNPLFDSSWYLWRYPEVVAQATNPLLHYVRWGARRGWHPHPLFDPAFYLAQAPESARANPLLHYLTEGGPAGLDPHPLFDTAFYLTIAPESARANPLIHYLIEGSAQGIDPNPWFDSAFYFEAHPDAAATALPPLVHYVLAGAPSGYVPHPSFSPDSYGLEHPDLLPEDLLAHRLRVGDRPSATVPTADDGVVVAAARPLNFHTGSASTTARLNVLLPSLEFSRFTGGPNTAVRVANAVAQSGIDVRFISTERTMDSSPAEFLDYCAEVCGEGRLPNLEAISGFPRMSIELRSRDAFLATAWATAHVARAAVTKTEFDRFFYLIQDFEPLLHPASTAYAMALDTYGFAHEPLVNSRLLFDFLVEYKIGAFTDRGFVNDATVLDPTPDPSLFYPIPRAAARPRRLLFYTRPNAPRNLYEIGLAAIRSAARRGAFDGEAWEFRSIGDLTGRINIDQKRVLAPLSQPPFDEWAQLMRESDLLVYLILSPHSGYAPLEMAACGGAVVTNAFGPKNEQRMAQYGHPLLVPRPTLEDVTSAISEAVTRLPEVDARRARAAEPGQSAHASNWLKPAAERIISRLS